jgi:hypothetical protein
MIFKNYAAERNERRRTAEARAEERQRKREEKSVQRKAEREIKTQPSLTSSDKAD